MTAYRVYFENLTYDRGLFDGFITFGYFATREKAENMKEKIEAEAKHDITVGKVFIEEILIEN